MNVLDEIVTYKRTEVEKRKKETSVNDLMRSPSFQRVGLSLKRFLLDPTRNGIIAEFKRQSPSKGIINDRVDVRGVTAAYANYGASGISVLTDTNFFGGSVNDLIEARASQIPILRKEFIIDEYQIIESKAIGADVILLIAAILTPEQVSDFTLKAHELGLEVILEIHSEEEAGHICAPVDIVGVNNRNLKTFQVDLEQSARLNGHIPDDKIKISESGIHGVKDILYLKSLGYKGFLIGENFMKEEAPGFAFMRFAELLKQTVV